MSTGSKILLALTGVTVVGIAYKESIHKLQFSLDGFEQAPDGGTTLARIKVVNPTIFGFPVPDMVVNAYDAQDNNLGTISNNTLQWIPSRSTSFIYAAVQPNFTSLVNLVASIITTLQLPSGLIFRGIIQIGPVQVPFDSSVSIPYIGAMSTIDNMEL